MRENFVIGVDFGTDSVRSVIIDAGNGDEIASSTFLFPRWRDKLFCDPSKSLFRQHPLDYIEGLEYTIRSNLKEAGEAVAKSVRGISCDTTGSTPVAVDESGTPLSLHLDLSENPNAMFILWKDHTAVEEAAEINRHAGRFDIDYLKYVGGIYSSEWFWAKLLHILRSDSQVREACYSWVEHCDWIPFLLTGGKHVSEIKRSRCAAGHKALWSEEFGGLPPADFFDTLDPLLKGFTQKLYTETCMADSPAGHLSKQWAERLGLTTDVVVGAGAFDAHMGAVGGQIESHYLSKVMGTSTCDILVAPEEEIGGKLINGICGQVRGSVVPGMIGMEAGQSAFGDVYAWFSKMIQWPAEHLLSQSSLINNELAMKLSREMSDKLINSLSGEAEKIPVDIDSEIALDWLNGRRTPVANQRLKASMGKLDLASDAPALFRAFAEATCFGAKKILDCFTDQCVAVKGLIGLGGVARKSPFIMQMMADVMDMPIRINRSEQTCALGAAMFAATASGIYSDVEEAMKKMGEGFDKEYVPDREKSAVYKKRYEEYNLLGDFTEKSLTD